MSKLVNYGPGEIIDRLTVLALKLQHGTDKSQLDQWRNELVTLLTKLRARESAPWLEQLLELAAVNAAPWTATDQLRELAQAYSYTDVVSPADTAKVLHLSHAGKLAFQILRWNDGRAQLVDSINRVSGDFVASDKGEK